MAGCGILSRANLSASEKERYIKENYTIEKAQTLKNIFLFQKYPTFGGGCETKIISRQINLNYPTTTQYIVKSRSKGD